MVDTQTVNAVRRTARTAHDSRAALTTRGGDDDDRRRDRGAVARGIRRDNRGTRDSHIRDHHNRARAANAEARRAPCTGSSTSMSRC